MSEVGSAAGITSIGTVIVPVSDQDRALAFFIDKLGFEKRDDAPYGEHSRWVEVAPPGAQTTRSSRPSDRTIRSPAST